MPVHRAFADHLQILFQTTGICNVVVVETADVVRIIVRTSFFSLGLKLGKGVTAAARHADLLQVQDVAWRQPHDHDVEMAIRSFRAIHATGRVADDRFQGQRRRVL